MILHGEDQLVMESNLSEQETPNYLNEQQAWWCNIPTTATSNNLLLLACLFAIGSFESRIRDFGFSGAQIRLPQRENTNRTESKFSASRNRPSHAIM